MRRVQASALELFEEHGFAAVTVEAIAARAEVGPATVYRNFGSKERIVLWDEYDPALMEAIGSRLPAAAPLAAVLEAIVAAVEGIYAEDAERILRRTRLLLAEPALRAAAAGDHAALVVALSEVFRARRAFGAALEREVAARAIAGALEAAALGWAREGGRRSLRHFLERAFERLATLG